MPDTDQARDNRVPLSDVQLQLLLASLHCVIGADTRGDGQLCDLRAHLESHMKARSYSLPITPAPAIAAASEARARIDADRKAFREASDLAGTGNTPRPAPYPSDYANPVNPAPARISKYNARDFWRGETVRHMDGRDGVVLEPATLIEAGKMAAPSLSYLWVDFANARECVAIGYLQKIPQMTPPGGMVAQGTGSPAHDGAKHEQATRAPGAPFSPI